MKQKIWRRLCILLVLVLGLTHLTGCALLYTSYELENAGYAGETEDRAEARTEEELAAERDAAEKSAAEKDAAEKSAAEKNAAEKNAAEKSIAEKDTAEENTEAAIDESGWYYSKDEVALYIHTYQKLPGNYITKKEAQALGWEGGAVESYAPGKVIGGDRFGNYEGLLPEKKGRSYTECDIDTKGKSRGAKRIVFSDDGQIYYTDDHYESFTLLYGEE